MTGSRIRAAVFIIMTALSLQACAAKKTDENSINTAKEPAPVIEFNDNESAISIEEDSDEPETVSEDEAGDGYNSELADKHIKLTITDSGADVFTPRDDGQQDYRYSPSILYNDDGSIDIWFASPGDGEDEYDWVSYRHSDDGGSTWSDEKIVLSPSPNTPDSLSICDPDVFFHDGYYYIGYTSTINKNEKGLCNSVFLARSENPDGPYEKWNGSGWGGSPVPIVYFNGLEIGWGCGEPSFVVLDDTLYMYSTRDSFSTVPDRLRVTEIRTADLKDPGWPAALKYMDHIVVVSDPSEESSYVYDDSDSWDVAYLEESHKFLAVCTNRRFKDDSCLLYFESDDGINFERVSEINKNVITKCHNCGIMADKNGHIKKRDPVLIGYAYAGSDNSEWGIWAARLAPAAIEYTDEPDRSDDHGENLKQPIKFKTSTDDAAPMMLRTDRLIYTCAVGDGAFSIGYYVRDNYRNERFIGRSGVKIESYDSSVVSVNSSGEITPKAEGMSLVRIEYNGLRRDISLCVMPSKDYNRNKLKSFFPIVSRYEIRKKEPFIVKVRPMAVFEGYEMHELTNAEILSYGVTFKSSDGSVCRVSGDGTVTPVSVGEAVITARSGNGQEFKVDVSVVDRDN